MSDAEIIALAVCGGVMLGCLLFIAYCIGVIAGRREKDDEMMERRQC